MNDPFATLDLFDDFEAASISGAFAAALARGVPMPEARGAMDAIRDPAQRAAMILVSPTMSHAARRERERSTSPSSDPAIETVLQFLRVVLEQLDPEVAAEAVLPTRHRNIDEFLPSMPDHFEP